MSLNVRRFSELSRDEITDLDRRMTAFYTNPPATYYQIADNAAAQYTPDQQPFHCDLVSRIKPGYAILEVGCGTAHLCPHVEHQGGCYTGLDHSDELLAQNRQRHPGARFFNLRSAPREQFDIVASLYTIEHVVDPPEYLDTLWSFCRPGGHIGIICPEFIESPANAPSLFYGNSPRRLREKLKSCSLLDAARHILDVKVTVPKWKHLAQTTEAGAFWINLSPVVLCGGEYQIDADAVHLVRRLDLIQYFEEKGARNVIDSSRLLNIPVEILKYNCYVLFEKPASTTK